MKRSPFLLSFMILLSFSSFSQNIFADWAIGLGSSGEDEAVASAIDNAGNIYVVGNYSGTVDFDPSTGTSNLTSNGGTDIFILKLNSSGSFIWAKSVGGTSYDRATGIKYDSFTSKLFVLGNFQGSNVDFDPGTGSSLKSSAGSTDAFILSLTNAGVFSWVQTFGGSSTDEALDFSITSGSIFIAGQFSGTCDFDPSTSTVNKTSNGYSDIFLLRLTSSGSYSWVNTIGGSDDDMATDIGVYQDNVYIAGTFKGGPIDFDPSTGTHNVTGNGYMEDVFVEKFDGNSGNFIWVKSFGGFDGERLQGMTVDNKGNVYSTGDFYMQVDFDPGVGVYNLSSHSNGNDIYIQKLDANGNFKWACSFGGDHPDLSQDIISDNDGNIYTYGDFSSQKIDLNPNADSVFFHNSFFQGNDAFIQKLDSLGNFIYAKTFGGTWFESTSSISIDDSSNIIVLGDYESDTLKLNTPGVINPVNQGYVDAFIVKYKESLPEINPSQSIFAAPPFAVTFQNNTGDSTNIRWFWDFGDGSFSNLMNPAHTYGYNGSYHVVLLAVDTISGNTDTTSVEIECNGGPTNSCNFSATLNQTGAAIICPNDSFKFSVVPSSGLSYSWFYNGITIIGANDSVFWGQPQGFYMAVVSNGSCSQTTDYFALANYPATVPNIQAYGNLMPCVNDSIELSTSNYSSYLWNTGAITQNIYVKNSGRYVVKGIDNNGCENTSLEKIINGSAADIPQICIVGFDSVNNHNVVVWEAPITNKIDSFIVYRETNITNVYSRIGAEPYSGNKYFIDMTSNPSVKQYRYSITSVDTCGTETPISISHATIHLMVNAAMGGHWNLIWRPYEGLSVSTYKIYRGSDSLNLQLIAQVSGSSFSYTDLNNPSGNIYYQIEAVTNSNCAVYNKIKSNSFNTFNASGVGFQSLANELTGISVYPNPTHGKFKIENTTNELNEVNLQIFNLLGKVIINESISFYNGTIKTIDLSNQPKGVYLVLIQSKDHMAYRGKIVIQ